MIVHYSIGKTYKPEIRTKATHDSNKERISLPKDRKMATNKPSHSPDSLKEHGRTTMRFDTIGICIPLWPLWSNVQTR